MKILHSLWTKPFEQTGYLHVNGGFPTPTHYWASWAYSALTAAKNYGRIDLVADHRGARVLTDVLHLPYQSVSTALDTLEVDPALWAAGKIVAYSLQDEPFWHIDNDAFLLKRLPDRFDAAGVLVQWREEQISMDFDRSYQGAKYVTDFGWRPDGWDNHWGDDRAYCTGIFGGTDVAMLREYSQQVLRMLRDPANTSGWLRARDTAQSPTLSKMNVVMEQQVAYCFLTERGVTPSMLMMPGEMERRVEIGRDLGFTHLQGRKGDRKQADRLLARLETEYPETYQRLIRHFDPAEVTPATGEVVKMENAPGAKPTYQPAKDRTMTVTAVRASGSRNASGGGCGCSRSSSSKRKG